MAEYQCPTCGGTHAPGACPEQKTEVCGGLTAERRADAVAVLSNSNVKDPQRKKTVLSFFEGLSESERAAFVADTDLFTEFCDFVDDAFIDDIAVVGNICKILGVLNNEDIQKIAARNIEFEICNNGGRTATADWLIATFEIGEEAVREQVARAIEWFLNEEAKGDFVVTLKKCVALQKKYGVPPTALAPYFKSDQDLLNEIVAALGIGPHGRKDDYWAMNNAPAFSKDDLANLIEGAIPDVKAQLSVSSRLKEIRQPLNGDMEIKNPEGALALLRREMGGGHSLRHGDIQAELEKANCSQADRDRAFETLVDENEFLARIGSSLEELETELRTKSDDELRRLKEYCWRLHEVVTAFKITSTLEPLRRVTQLRKMVSAILEERDK